MAEQNEFGQPVGDPVPGWAPREAPRPVMLDGVHVRLEPIAATHAQPLFEAVCGAEDRALWTYRSTEPPTDIASMARYIAGYAADQQNITWVIVPDGGRAEGVVSFMRIDPVFGSVEAAGILYSRRLQRTTAATEAIHLLMRYAFDDLGYRRFEWKCDSLNEPSKRAAARLGFTYEGRFRNHMVTKGRNRDTDWFSVTDAEWPAVRAAHEKWLDPANFDADGRQLTSLSTLTRG